LNKVQKLTRRATKIISAHRQKFEDCQGTIVEMAQAALRRYAKQEASSIFVSCTLLLALAIFDTVADFILVYLINYRERTTSFILSVM
jgi:hypothetical protein